MVGLRTGGGVIASRVASKPDVGRSTRLGLLDRFSLDVDGSAQRLSGSAQRLLAFVALHEGPVSRQRAAFTLWPTANEAHAYGSLRAALFRLRAGSVDQLLETAAELELCPSVVVDVRRARTLAAMLGEPVMRRRDEQELETLLLGGELLPDWYDDWVVVEREQFHEVRLRALDALCEAHQRANDTAGALRCALAAVQADPLRERSCRTLIRVQLADGNHAGALAQARKFAQALEPLGLAPSRGFDEFVHELGDR
jgi:DNA-binding SARP family transcriptional activator